MVSRRRGRTEVAVTLPGGSRRPVTEIAADPAVRNIENIGPIAAAPMDPAWAARVDRALSEIAAGDLEKLVLARSRTIHAPGRCFDPVATARALREAHPGCHVFAWGRPDGSALVGATPEVLVEGHGSWIRTMALAGTAPADQTGALDTPKVRHEQAVVLAAIRGLLAPLTDPLSSSPTVVARHGRLAHLGTLIEGHLTGGMHWLDAAALLHPTPAVGGRPRDKALAWLDRHEGLARGWYAGPIGHVSASGDGTLAVALRCALLRGDRAVAFAGAGLVAGSEAQAEWDETELKLAAVLDCLRTAREVRR
jgi:isochorismate synthase